MTVDHAARKRRGHDPEWDAIAPAGGWRDTTSITRIGLSDIRFRLWTKRPSGFRSSTAHRVDRGMDPHRSPFRVERPGPPTSIDGATVLGIRPAIASADSPTGSGRHRDRPQWSVAQPRHTPDRGAGLALRHHRATANWEPEPPPVRHERNPRLIRHRARGAYRRTNGPDAPSRAHHHQI